MTKKLATEITMWILAGKGCIHCYAPRRKVRAHCDTCIMVNCQELGHRRAVEDAAGKCYLEEYVRKHKML